MFVVVPIVILSVICISWGFCVDQSDAIIRISLGPKLCHLTYHPCPHSLDVLGNINLKPCNKLLKAPDADVTNKELSEQAKWQSFREMKLTETSRATRAAWLGHQ